MEDLQQIQRANRTATELATTASIAQLNSPTSYLRLLVEAMMAGGPMQRPVMSRQIGLPKHAISDLLAQLEIRGLVQVAGTVDGLPGRSQQSYSLRTDAALALGFDVGGTKVAGALCDMRGTILAEQTIPTDRGGADALVAQIATMADALCAEAGVPRHHVRNNVVGVPAAVDPYSRKLSLAGNLPGLEGASLSDGLTKALGGTVYLDNDVNLALIAEVAQGSARSHSNVVFVALGTGIGSAMLINGRLLRGAFGGAGEIGYMPLWRLEPTGQAPLEQYTGESGIRQLYVAAGGDEMATVRDIFDAATNGDAAALSALDKAAEGLSRALVCLLAVVDADLMVFGGSIGSREEFIDRVRSHVGAAWMRPVEITRSTAGGRAGLLGALELSRQQMLEQLFGVAPQAS